MVTPPWSVNLMALSTRLDLTEAVLIAVEEAGQGGVDFGGEGEAGASGGFGKEVGDVVEAVAHGAGAGDDLEAARLDFGEVEDVGYEAFEGVAAALDGLDVGELVGAEGGAAQEAGKAYDAVDGGANLMADDGEEFAFGPVGGLGGLLGFAQGDFGLFAHGDVVAHGLVFDQLAVAVFDRAVGP